MKLGFWFKLKRLFKDQYGTAALLTEHVETLSNGDTITRLVLEPVLAGQIVEPKKGDINHYLLITTQFDLNEAIEWKK